MKQETLKQAVILDAKITRQSVSNKDIDNHIKTLSTRLTNESVAESVQRFQDTYLDIQIGNSSPKVKISYQNIIDMLESEKSINETRKNQLQQDLDVL